MLTKSWPLRSKPRKYSPQQAEKWSASGIFPGKNLMQLPEFTRSTTLRWTVLVAGIFAALIVALLGFVYLKTKDDLTMRSDRLIASQMGFFAHVAPQRRPDPVDALRKQD